VRELEQELSAGQHQYEMLTQHAGDKLQQAAAQYISVQRAEAEKEARLQQTEEALAKLKQRTKRADGEVQEKTREVTQLRQTVDELDQAFQASKAEIASLAANLSSTMSELALIQQKDEELQAINIRYKEQLVASREAVRQLSQSRDKLDDANQRTAEAQARIKEMEDENTRLKSQLFDSMDMEKQLKAQLAAQGKAFPASNRGDAIKLEQCQRDLLELQRALDTKEHENRELMGICEQLLRDCEQLKRQKK